MGEISQKVGGLGPDYLHVVQPRELYAFYLAQGAMAGFGAIGGLFATPLITFLCAGASQGGLVYPLGEGGPALRYDSYPQAVAVISVLAQILVFVLFGAVGDFGKGRKYGFIASSVFSSCCITLGE
jgi:hypothetical protein